MMRRKRVAELYVPFPDVWNGANEGNVQLCPAGFKAEESLADLERGYDFKERV